MSIDTTPDGQPIFLDPDGALQTVRELYRRVVGEPSGGGSRNDGPPAPKERARKIDPGTRIDGRYAVVREVSRGGMGVLFKCQHVHSGQEVMVKALRPEFAASPEHQERLRREGRALAKAECDHLVRLRDMGEDPATGAPYLVLDFLRGEDLSSLLGRRPRLEFTEAMLVIVPVMQALMRLHSVGFVHRDVNPNNIFLARLPSGGVRPVLIDLGIARVRAAEEPYADDAVTGVLPNARHRAAPRTVNGMLLGTPPYMAPEQVENVGKVDQRTDVWAVAVTFYEALSGVNPFGDGDTPHKAVFEAIHRRDVPRLDGVVPGVPAAFARAVERAMSRDPAARFASMQHFLDALNEGAGRASPLRFATSPPLAHLAHRAERSAKAVPAPVERLPSELLEPIEHRAAPATVRLRDEWWARRDVLLAAVVALNLVTLATLAATMLRRDLARSASVRVAAPARRAEATPTRITPAEVTAPAPHAEPVIAPTPPPVRELPPPRASASAAAKAPSPPRLPPRPPPPSLPRGIF